MRLHSTPSAEPCLAQSIPLFSLTSFSSREPSVHTRGEVGGVGESPTGTATVDPAVAHSLASTSHSMTLHSLPSSTVGPHPRSSHGSHATRRASDGEKMGAVDLGFRPWVPLISGSVTQWRMQTRRDRAAIQSLGGAETSVGSRGVTVRPRAKSVSILGRRGRG